MSSDEEFELIEIDREALKMYQKRLNSPKKLTWKFTSDWVGLEFNPCLDLEIQLFDISLFCIYILPWNRLVGFQIFGIGMEWSW